MALDSTSKAIAAWLEKKRKAITTEAWSQLVCSMISGTPPRDMEPEYYYAHLVLEKSEHLETHDNMLGTKNIQAGMRSGMHSQVARAQAHDDVQGIEHIQDCTRSSKHSEVRQVNEYQNQPGIEHILDCMRSTKHYDHVVPPSEEENRQGIDHIQYCMRSAKHYEALQANDQHNNQQGIEHIQNRMISAMHYQVVRENEHGNRQGVQGIQDSIRSPLLSKPREYAKHQSINNILETRSSHMLEKRTYVNQHYLSRMQAHMLSLWFDKLLDLVEDGDLQGKEKLILDPKVVCLVKLLHHYGVDTIRNGVVEQLENLNGKHVDIEKDLEIQYKKKGLEVMLRICDNEMCQKTIHQIIGKAEKGQVVYEFGE